MHGKKFLLERAYAGIGLHDLYMRLDLAQDLEGEFQIYASIEVLPAGVERPRRTFVASFQVEDHKLAQAYLSAAAASSNGSGTENGERIAASLHKSLRTQIPLSKLAVGIGDRLLLRFSLSRAQLLLDALPQQGWMELPVVPEEQMLETGDYAW
jgi:hypothetical protein